MEKGPFTGDFPIETSIYSVSSSTPCWHRRVVAKKPATSRCFVFPGPQGLRGVFGTPRCRLIRLVPSYNQCPIIVFQWFTYIYIHNYICRNYVQNTIINMYIHIYIYIQSHTYCHDWLSYIFPWKCKVDDISWLAGIHPSPALGSTCAARPLGMLLLGDLWPGQWGNRRRVETQINAETQRSPHWSRWKSTV